MNKLEKLAKRIGQISDEIKTLKSQREINLEHCHGSEDEDFNTAVTKENSNDEPFNNCLYNAYEWVKADREEYVHTMFHDVIVDYGCANCKGAYLAKEKIGLLKQEGNHNMSNKKKSFLLHIDSLDILDDLTNGQAGVLFKAIKAYQHDEEFPLDSVVKIAFSPFKNQFFRDDEKYTETCKRRAIAGSKGGKQKVANASNSKQDLANLADNKNKNKTKNKSDNDNEVTNDRFAEFWNLYGKKKDTDKCKTKFSKLTKSEIELLFTNLPAYIKSTPDKQYRKNPITWLNGKCWNDEIIQNQQATSTHSFGNQNYTSGKF